MAPHGTDARQRIREGLVQGEPSLALDWQLNAHHTAQWIPAPTPTTDLPKLRYNLGFSLTEYSTERHHRQE